MSVTKHFVAQIYDQDGSTLLRTLTTEMPLDTTLPHLKSVPTFSTRINGGQGECVLDINFPFDNFEEGSTVNFMNIVKLYCVKVDRSAASQTQTLLYTGFVSKYDTYVEQDGSEGVRMTCLGLVSLLAASYYKNGSSFTVTHSTVDPETIGHAIIDHVNSIFGGSLFSYSGSTTSSVGTSVSITFTDQKWNDALKKTGELAGTDWWWKVDESGQYWLKAKPSSPTHTFTIRRDIVSLNARRTLRRSSMMCR